MTFEDTLAHLKLNIAPEPTIDQQTGKAVQRVTIDCDGLSKDEIKELSDALSKNTWVQRVLLENCTDDYAYKKFATAIYMHNQNESEPTKIKIDRLVFLNSTATTPESLRILASLLANDEHLKLVVFPATSVANPEQFIFSVANPEQVIFSRKMKTQSVILSALVLSEESLVSLTKSITENTNLQRIHFDLYFAPESIRKETIPNSNDVSYSFENESTTQNLIELFKAMTAHPSLLSVQISCGASDEAMQALMSVIPEVSIQERELLESRNIFSNEVHEADGKSFMLLNRAETTTSENTRRLVDSQHYASQDEFIDVVVDTLLSRLRDKVNLEYDDDEDKDEAKNVFEKLSAQQNRQTIKRIVIGAIGSKAINASDMISFVQAIEKIEAHHEIMQTLYTGLTTGKLKNFTSKFQSFTNPPAAPPHLKTGL